MKPYNLPQIIHPLYILVTGILGLALPIYMYFWNFPAPNDASGLKFVSAQSFLTWVFLIAVLFSTISIILIPAWVIFIRLFRHVKKQGVVTSGKLINVLLLSTLLFFAVGVALFFLPLKIPNIPYPPAVAGVTSRFVAVYSFTFAGVLPVILGIVLINYVAKIMSEQIPSAIKNEIKLFEFINDYLGYRTMLQNYLLTLGIISAMNPLITAAFFSIGLDLKISTTDTFPKAGILIYGLILTLALLFIYAPSYLNLINVGKNLRDLMYPFNSLDGLGDTMAKRDRLDNLLQTKVSIIENLKSGIFSFGPLLTSVIATLFHS